jgi:antitoxin component YwqK of YwqJK toxin-antitoxin module
VGYLSINKKIVALILATTFYTIACSRIEKSPFDESQYYRVSTTYFDAGKQHKKDEYFQLESKQGKRILVKSYNIDGSILLKEFLLNEKEDGPIISYYQNGKIFMDGEFVDGQRSGFSHVYYPSGKLRFLTSYKNGMELMGWKFDTIKNRLFPYDKDMDKDKFNNLDITK